MSRPRRPRRLMCCEGWWLARRRRCCPMTTLNCSIRCGRRGNCVASPPKDTITQLAVCLLRGADRYRPREFGIHESDGAPDEKERRPKQQPPGYQACVMRGEVWPRRQEDSFSPDAGPPRCAQLMGLALRRCLVLVLGATAERRNLFFRSDLGLPWIRFVSLRLSK